MEVLLSFGFLLGDMHNDAFTDLVYIPKTTHEMMMNLEDFSDLAEALIDRVERNGRIPSLTEMDFFGLLNGDEMVQLHRYLIGCYTVLCDGNGYYRRD